MSPAPSVSVVIPTFQRRDLLQRALACVLAQTRPDLEVIVADDGSTDGTVAAISGCDPRLRVVEQANAGPAAARNAALAVAGAPVVAFLDSDDLWREDHLAVLLGLLERHPGAVLASAQVADLGVDALDRPEGTLDAVPDVLLGGYLYMSGVAIRRPAIEELGGFDEGLRVTEDSDLWCRLALEGPFAFSSEQTVTSGTEPSSLRDEGRAAGVYPAAHERVALRFVDRVRDTADRRSRAENRRLVDAGRGAAALARALEALVAGDENRARNQLALGAALFPELATEPTRVVRRLGRAHPGWEDEDARERTLAILSRVWPGDASRLERVAA